MSVVAALVLGVGIAMIIPLVVRRYVSRPLAELTEKVTRFSNEGEFGKGPAADEVRLLTEEFWKVDDQLVKARADLLERHRRELELERRLQHAERLATIGTLASGLATKLARRWASFVLGGVPACSSIHHRRRVNKASRSSSDKAIGFRAL